MFQEECEGGNGKSKYCWLMHALVDSNLWPLDSLHKKAAAKAVVPRSSFLILFLRLLVLRPVRHLGVAISPVSLGFFL